VLADSFGEIFKGGPLETVIPHSVEHNPQASSPLLLYLRYLTVQGHYVQRTSLYHRDKKSPPSQLIQCTNSGEIATDVLWEMWACTISLLDGPFSLR